MLRCGNRRSVSLRVRVFASGRAWTFSTEAVKSGATEGFRRVDSLSSFKRGIFPPLFAMEACLGCNRAASSRERQTLGQAPTRPKAM